MVSGASTSPLFDETRWHPLNPNPSNWPRKTSKKPQWGKRDKPAAHTHKRDSLTAATEWADVDTTTNTAQTLRGIGVDAETRTIKEEQHPTVRQRPVKVT
jgi:hypothetical protein